MPESVGNRSMIPRWSSPLYRHYTDNAVPASFGYGCSEFYLVSELKFVVNSGGGWPESEQYSRVVTVFT